MLAPNPATMTENCHILSGWANVCSRPTTHFNAKSRIVVLNQIRMKRSFTSYGNGISMAPANVFRKLGRPGLGSENLGLRSIRVSSGGGGNDGFGGSGGGGSGGGDGSSSGGDNGSNWSLLSWYLSLLAKHPVITKAVTSAILTLVGDLICQILIDQVKSLDLRRTFTFTLLGLALVGPTLHFWYLYLSQLVTTSGASGAIFRLLLDQFLFSPIFIGTFLSTLVTLEGKPSLVVPKLQQEWFSSVFANWQLWIPFQFLNFRFVPQQFQVLAANFIALIWNVILSYKAHKEVVAK